MTLLNNLFPIFGKELPEGKSCTFLIFKKFTAFYQVLKQRGSPNEINQLLFSELFLFCFVYFLIKIVMIFFFCKVNNTEFDINFREPRDTSF